jgi:thioredoxin 1
MAHVQPLTDATFDAEVMESPMPVLVDFSATWCGPCKRLAPVVEEIGKEFAGKVKVMSVDIDDGAETASRFAVTAVPTLVVFKGGKEVARLQGVVPKGRIADALTRLLTP